MAPISREQFLAQNLDAHERLVRLEELPKMVWIRFVKTIRPGADGKLMEVKITGRKLDHPYPVTSDLAVHYCDTIKVAQRCDKAQAAKALARLERMRTGLPTVPQVQADMVEKQERHNSRA